MTPVRAERAAGKAGASTATRILDSAERLAQTRGFNGFSYADIAAELGLTKASLHHHFGSKAELGSALIARYEGRFAAALDEIDAEVESPLGKLAAYAEIYADVLRQRRMCLCGMLAADYETLPPAMQGAVIDFFDRNESWLTSVVEEGRREGSLASTGSASEVAQMIVSGLEGAMLVARSYGDVSRFDAAAEGLLAMVRGRV